VRGDLHVLPVDLEESRGAAQYGSNKVNFRLVSAQMAELETTRIELNLICLSSYLNRIVEQPTSHLDAGYTRSGPASSFSGSERKRKRREGKTKLGVRCRKRLRD
jgi:hypothetical protein